MQNASEEQLAPIDWWVWHRKRVKALAVVTAATRLRAVLEGVSKVRALLPRVDGKSPTVGIDEVDAQAWREGDTRESVLAQLAARRAA